MDSHLSRSSDPPLRLFQVTTRTAFTGEVRRFEVMASDAYHAACQAKQVAKHDLIVRITYA